MSAKQDPSEGPGASVNAGGVKGAWSVLRELMPQYKVTLLQETCFLDREEEEAYRRTAFSKGFRFWCLESYSNDKRGYRSVGMLVRSESWRHREAQVLAVKVEGIYFLALYSSASGETMM